LSETVNDRIVAECLLFAGEVLMLGRMIVSSPSDFGLLLIADCPTLLLDC
jgi:hypothetical protein